MVMTSSVPRTVRSDLINDEYMSRFLVSIDNIAPDSDMFVYLFTSSYADEFIFRSCDGTSLRILCSLRFLQNLLFQFDNCLIDCDISYSLYNETVPL